MEFIKFIDSLHLHILQLIQTIISEYGTADYDLLEKKLKEMRILENVDLPAKFADLIVKPEKSSTAVPSEEIEESEEEDESADAEKSSTAVLSEEIEESKEEDESADAEKSSTAVPSEEIEESKEEDESADAKKSSTAVLSEEVEESEEEDESADEEKVPVKKREEEKKKKVVVEPPKLVRMANLCVVGGHAVNGVAEIHSEIVKDEVFNSFYKVSLDSFSKDEVLSMLKNCSYY